MPVNHWRCKILSQISAQWWPVMCCMGRIVLPYDIYPRKSIRLAARQVRLRVGGGTQILLLQWQLQGQRGATATGQWRVRGLEAGEHLFGRALQDAKEHPLSGQFPGQLAVSAEAKVLHAPDRDWADAAVGGGPCGTVTRLEPKYTISTYNMASAYCILVVLMGHTIFYQRGDFLEIIIR